MKSYRIKSQDVEGLIKSGVANTIAIWRGVECTFIGHLRLTRPMYTGDDWHGPYAPNPYLEDVLEEHGIEWDHYETDDEVDRDAEASDDLEQHVRQQEILDDELGD